MKTRLLILLLILMGTACSRSYELYHTRDTVTFSCDISRPPFNKVQTSGYFLAVRLTPMKDGYKVRLPEGKEEPPIPLTERELRTFRFGLAGLIVGKPYFGNEEFYAYDLGCPQCDRASIQLSVTPKGIATCSKCNTSYDLNNGGIAQMSDSRPLYRYRTSLSGSTLMVHN